MSHGLFWKLFAILVAGTVALFTAIHWLVNHTEQRMSYIKPEHRQQLEAWAYHAEHLYYAGNQEELDTWVLKLQAQEQTWVAIVGSQLNLIAGEHMDEEFVQSFKLGRSVDLMIHLYYDYNPIMGVMFADGENHFLIRLPQRMRPGHLWQPTQLAIQIALPFILLAFACYLLYRHLASPIRKLERATRQFSEGHYQARVSDSLGNRNDELGSLAKTFDAMAEHTGGLIVTQRQLIADLSHELRTPITRIELALNGASETETRDDSLQRIQREVRNIRELAEDALTLAWIDTEKPQICSEPLDLVDLLDSILDDARFEFPDRDIAASLPESAPLQQSCQRILGQAIENVIRNALRYTPAGGRVEINLRQPPQNYLLEIQDQGPGVPEQHLQSIFKPFFRVETSRGKDSGGFGLGLALAKRQIEAVSGVIHAENSDQGGLKMLIKLPCD